MHGNNVCLMEPASVANIFHKVLNYIVGTLRPLDSTVINSTQIILLFYGSKFFTILIIILYYQLPTDQEDRRVQTPTHTST